MKLYFAGGVVLDGFEAMFQEMSIRWRLLTFADIDDWMVKAFAYWTSPLAKDPFFLDSGAFAAKTRGAEIDLDRYCQFIKDYERYIHPYASLDVIGDWQGSADNYDIMLERGLHPLPTFHMDSPDHELHRLLKMTDYLALGGVVGARENDMRPWLDRCFRIIEHYWPKKIHIFGAMAQWCLERYPFYSADSSGAIVGGGMGRVTVFEDGVMENYDWRDYAEKFYEGEVMDHVSLSRSAGKTGSAHMARRKINLASQLQLERYITDVWTQRGVVWED